MIDPKFNIINNQSNQPRRSQLWQKVGLAIGGASVLVASAIYAPLVWKTGSAGASNTITTSAAPARQLAQIDASLVEDQEALAALYEQLAPSVVSIQVTGQSQADVQLPEGFELPPGFDVPGQGQPQRGEGSGWIYDNNGHIVTNNHVVEGAQDIVVTFNNGFWAEAELVATDPQADLAVLKVTPPDGFDWQPLTLADPATLKVGHMVIAMGNPFQLENTMTTGIISALGRDFPVGGFGQSRYSLPGVIQTDAAINPGNSGGPLLNLNGEVVGVNFAIESQLRQNSGVGFVIPTAIIERVVPALIADGKFSYPYLGLSGQTIGPDLARALDLPNTLLGAYVASVIEGGPSADAGVVGGDPENPQNGGGDIVIAIDDEPVTGFEDMVNYLVTKAEPGQTVTLTVLRDGEEMQIDVELGTRPGETAQARIEPNQGDQGQGNGGNNGGTQRSGRVSPRQAIQIATEAAQDQLDGEVTQVTTVPDQVDGKDVWVVELSTDSQTATVTIDRENGDVIAVVVE